MSSTKVYKVNQFFDVLVSLIKKKVYFRLDHLKCSTPQVFTTFFSQYDMPFKYLNICCCLIKHFSLLLLFLYFLSLHFKKRDPQPVSNTNYSCSTETTHSLMNTFKLFNLDMESCFRTVLWCKTKGEGQRLMDHMLFHRLQSKTVLIVTVYNPSCHNIVNWASHNRRVWLIAPNPLPWVSVSCWWQGMQAGLGWAHHWRRQIQYPSGGGRNAQVQRLRPVPQAQPLIQSHREPVAGTLSAVLQLTA